MAEQVLKSAARSEDRLSIPELARRARIRRLLGIGVLIAAAGAGIAYLRRPDPVLERYRTEPVTRRDVVQLVESAGTLDVRSRTEVPAPIEGRLITSEVHEGDRVEQGQLLGTLDARSAQLAVQSAHAAVEAAAGRLAEAEAARAAADRAQQQATRLQQKGLASPAEVENADSELARAKAAATAARAERKLALQDVERAQLGQNGSQIRAPATGVVLRAPDRLGAAVSPERGPLFVIGEPLEIMRLRALVSETDIAHITPGSKAEVVVQALPSRRFKATVERVGIEPNKSDGAVQYPVTMLVDNPDGALLPGMSARVRIEIGRAEHALAVHEAALRYTPEGREAGAPRTRVWRHGKKPNQIEAVDVRVGVSDGVYSALLPDFEGGLSEGDQLVVGLLRPGEVGNTPSMSLGGKR